MTKIKKLFENISLKSVIILICSSAVMAFALYNVHDVADVTEGGILGLDLLLDHWFGISPAYTDLFFTSLCFIFGWKTLGIDFIIYSAFSTLSFAFFYRIIEHTPRLFPDLASHPLAAALLGAVLVGISAGLSVREGGAMAGDDALAMSLHRRFGWNVSAVYLASDLIVLLLSLTYIPPKRIVFSLITVIISGQIIELITRTKKK